MGFLKAGHLSHTNFPTGSSLALAPSDGACGGQEFAVPWAHLRQCEWRAAESIGTLPRASRALAPRFQFARAEFAGSVFNLTTRARALRQHPTTTCTSGCKSGCVVTGWHDAKAIQTRESQSESEGNRFESSDSSSQSSQEEGAHE